MTEHLNWFTVLLNHWFGGAVLSLLHALHITPNDPANPIPNYVAMGIVVFLIAVLFFLWLKPRISVDKPGAVQQVRRDQPRYPRADDSDPHRRLSTHFRRDRLPRNAILLP